MKTSEKLVTTFHTIPWLPLILLDKLHLVQGKILYKTKTNLYFLARAGTSDIEEIIVIASGYAYPLDLLPNFKCPTIIDLGGYIGEFCLYANTYYKKNCHIYAYEPSEENFYYLKLNTLLNNAAIKIFMQGIHTYRGKGYIATQGISSDEYSVRSQKESVTDQQCEVVTLNDIQQKNRLKKIDILKIDIEGMEYELIKNRQTLDIIKKYVLCLFIECHELSSTKSSHTILKRLTPFFDIVTKRDHVFLLRNKHL
jgi:FkbM family methyltransferase